MNGRAIIIAHEPGETGGQIEVRLRQRGFAVHTHQLMSDRQRPDRFAPIPDWHPFHLVVMMGSSRSLTQKDEIDGWIDDELEMIRRAHQRETPLLGVCFGGQVIAEALGGSVERAPVTELGWYEIEPAGGLTSPAGRGPWMQWHHDRFLPPVAAQILAVSAAAVQLFRLGRTVGAQFHPEVDVEHVTRWLSGTSDEYLVEHGASRDGLLRSVRENETRNIEQCHALVDWYLDEVAFAD